MKVMPNPAHTIWITAIQDGQYLSMRSLLLSAGNAQLVNGFGEARTNVTGVLPNIKEHRRNRDYGMANTTYPPFPSGSGEPMPLSREFSPQVCGVVALTTR